MQTNDFSNMITLGSDVNDIWKSFAAIACLAATFFISFVIQGFVYFCIHLLCRQIIMKNDNQRIKRVLQSSNPMGFERLTSSRVGCIHLTVGWTFLILISYGILLFFNCRTTILVSLGSSTLLLPISFFAQSKWAWSFIMRFAILWDDIARVGDIIIIDDLIMGRLSHMTNFGVSIYILNKSDVIQDAHEECIKQKIIHNMQFQNKCINKITNNNKIDMVNMMETVAKMPTFTKKTSNHTPTKFVSYVELLCPNYAWIIHDNNHCKRDTMCL